MIAFIRCPAGHCEAMSREGRSPWRTRGRADLQTSANCPSTYYDHLAKLADPERLSDRAKRDGKLCPEIQRVFEANFQVYGVRKVWRQMCREGFDVARCTVEG
jgi:hypothetical protein